MFYKFVRYGLEYNEERYERKKADHKRHSG